MPISQLFQGFNSGLPSRRSNNSGFQNILGGFDPYRGQAQSPDIRRITDGGPGRLGTAATAGQVPPTFAHLLRNVPSGSTVNVSPNLQSSFTQALAPYQPFTPGGQAGVFPALLDYIRGLGTGGTTTQPPVGVGGGQPVQPDANAAAARLLGGAVASNPFVTGAGVERLSSGLLPELNAFNPAFSRYTSPLITQAMQGLFQSAGVPLAHQQFLQEMFRPPGFG